MYSNYGFLVYGIRLQMILFLVFLNLPCFDFFGTIAIAPSSFRVHDIGMMNLMEKGANAHLLDLF